LSCSVFKVQVPSDMI